MERVLSNKAQYMPCWLSFTGAVAGALKALGVNCDTIDVGGLSGYSFIINVSKGRTCPSGPTALHIDVFRQMLKATEGLGYRIELFTHAKSNPKDEEGFTPEERVVVKKVFEMIKREIDGGKPAVLWGLFAPEYGIVNGYRGTSYVASTFRSVTGQPEPPVPYDDLKAPGCIDALFFRDKSEAPCDQGLEALERACKNASGKLPIAPHYVAGPLALDEWAKVLEEMPEGKQDYMGNSYVGACVSEGRMMCAEYLLRLSKAAPPKPKKALLNASAYYSKSHSAMEEFTKIFPFAFEGKMPSGTRREGAEILRSVKVFEEGAIQEMVKALEYYESP